MCLCVALVHGVNERNLERPLNVIGVNERNLERPLNAIEYNW